MYVALWMSKLKVFYLLNFVAGEEDSEFRKRLRRKVRFSFAEFDQTADGEGLFEAEEAKILEGTFENTVYNALYISDITS